MFTKNNTMNEILNTEPVGRAAGNLFPTCFMARVPVEHGIIRWHRLRRKKRWSGEHHF